MRAPERSYILWFSQRVGSSMLSGVLESMGIAGRPREWFNAPTIEALLATRGVNNGRELRDVVWREGTTPNGVLALKYSMHPPHHAQVSALLGEGGWAAFFPSCRHFLLTRRDKVRLAVSWWRAIQSHEWHRPVGNLRRAPDFVDAYDSRAIANLVAEAEARERAILDQLAQWNVAPRVFVYEDWITKLDETVHAILDDIGVAHRDIAVPAPALEPLSDAISETWYRWFEDQQ